MKNLRGGYDVPVPELAEFSKVLTGSLIFIIINLLLVGGLFGLAIKLVAPDCNPFADGVLAGAVRSTLFGWGAVILLIVSMYFLGCLGPVIWLLLFFGGMRMVFDVGWFRTIIIVIVFIVLQWMLAMIFTYVVRPPTPSSQGPTNSVKPTKSKTIPLRQQEWTAGFGDKDIKKWKGQSADNVIKFFGRPDSTKDLGQGRGVWGYSKMRIAVQSGKNHSKLSFIIINGQVTDVITEP